MSNKKCEKCPLYQKKLDEVLKIYSSGFDIMIEMTEFIKTCNCEYNLEVISNDSSGIE